VTETNNFQVWRTANGQLFRLATAEEVEAQTIHDATRPLTKYERARPKRKNPKKYTDVVELTLVREPLNIYPIGVADKKYFHGLQVIQIPTADLIEHVNANQDITEYLKEANRDWREQQRLVGK
jgi:hypothetical protein